MLKTDFANDQLSQLSSSYLEALNGEIDEIILESGVTRESYNSLGRDSSLLPPDIIEGIFDSKRYCFILPNLQIMILIFWL